MIATRATPLLLVQADGCHEPLNDDRIGRALDAIAPQLEPIVGSVGATAIAGFGLDVARLHWDMTSISLYGACRDAQQGFATPRFGHPKDRRPDLKQIQTGLAVTGDGGVPVFHRAYHGGAGEVSQVTAAMESLRKLAGPRKFLMVGDSKLVSYPNLRAMDEAGVQFIAPASKTYVKAPTLAAQHLQPTTDVDYVAERDLGKAPELRGRWRVREDTMAMAPPKATRTNPGPAPGFRLVLHPRQPPHTPGPRSSNGPAVTSPRWSAASAAATTPTPQPSSSAPAPSPARAASPATYAPTSAPTPLPANPP